MNDVIIGIVVFVIYYLGCVIYCILHRKDIGTKECIYEMTGHHEYTIDSVDIAFKSMFWPLILVIVIILLPVYILTLISKKKR